MPLLTKGIGIERGAQRIAHARIVTYAPRARRVVSEARVDEDAPLRLRRVLPGRPFRERQTCAELNVVCERRAKASLRRPMHSSAAYEWFREAMTWYAKAEPIRPAGNDDALLRWNTCARIVMHNTHLQPREEETAEPYLE